MNEFNIFSERGRQANPTERCSFSKQGESVKNGGVL